MFIDVFRFALRQGRLRPVRHLLWEKSREGGRQLRVLRSRDDARCQNGEKLIGLKKPQNPKMFMGVQ